MQHICLGFRPKQKNQFLSCSIFLSKFRSLQAFFSALLTVWPDLAKFRHCGKLFQVLANILRVYLVCIWQNVETNLVTFVCHWATFYCCKWKKLKNSRAIWSHWRSISLLTLSICAYASRAPLWIVPIFMRLTFVHSFKRKLASCQLQVSKSGLKWVGR